MGWPYSMIKWRNRVRAEYTAETGGDDYAAPAFMAWMEAKGYLP